MKIIHLIAETTAPILMQRMKNENSEKSILLIDEEKPPLILRNISVPELKGYEPHLSKRQLNKPHKHEYKNVNGVWKCQCTKQL